MSTLIKKFFNTATLCLIVFLSNSLAFSQDLELRVTLVSSTDSKILIEGKFLEDRKLIERNWSFLKSYADAEGLGKRVSNLKLSDELGSEILYKKFADGEFVAEGNATKFSYIIDANALPNTSANAHVSWVDGNRGLLMLNDLLPTLAGEDVSLNITMDLPDSWKFSSVQSDEFMRVKTSVESDAFMPEKTSAKRDVFTAKAVTLNDRSIFLIGKDWREREILIDQSRIKFLILDEWQFEDELAFDMTEEIAKEYAELFGKMPFKDAQIILMDFPKKFERGRWRAETRGSNVTILSSQSFAKSIAEQRLHEQLRHEIFHLWIPNSLNLSGDYAWFYEGFAIYQALRTGVWLGQIRFEDYLETLEQAYFLDQKRSANNSLIDISNRRWNGEVSSVYAKGMLVAFLSDAALLEKSKGKKDIADIFREIYKKHGKPSERKDANDSVLNVLQEKIELAPIIEKYIKGTEKIDWTKYLAVFGIEDFGNSAKANLKLRKKLSGRQKALLKKLGYNRRRNFKIQKINKN